MYQKIMKSSNTCLEDWLATLKDETNLPLDVAALVIMPALMIKEGFMITIEAAVVKGNFVTADFRCHRLV